MSRVLTEKTRRALLDATPQPTEWPVCGECSKDFILVRALLVRVPKGKAMEMHMGWTWKRDCRHRGAKVNDRIERENPARRKGAGK
jgi:hypothetical protein